MECLNKHHMSGCSVLLGLVGGCMGLGVVIGIGMAITNGTGTSTGVTIRITGSSGRAGMMVE